MYKTKLCSINTQLISSWKKEFKNYPEVEIIKGDIFSQKADAIVCPGNSFGLMDAGLDKLAKDYFGLSLEKKLQEKIKTIYYGELPVGVATILETDNKEFPYFISSPTMRAPMRLKESVNVYLATRAIFVAINQYNKNHNKIQSVIIPGMGVGSGKMPYDIAAKQMRIAYESTVYKNTNFPTDWKEAVQYHKGLKS